MKTALVIDDDRIFNPSDLGCDSIVYARDEASGLLRLKRWSDYTVVVLDHDLGEGQDGRTCGRELERLAFETDATEHIKILVISDNPAGIQELRAATRAYQHLKRVPTWTSLGASGICRDE